LIHGAAGGVGSFAVQLAHYKKAHVIATVSATNANFVMALGADEVIDYRTTPFEAVVRDVDVVLDTVGGETRDRSWEVLKKGGRLVTIAADAERFSDPRVRDAFFIVESNRVQLIEISRLIDTGVIRPVVGAVFPMEDVRHAYEQKPLRGKHVLYISGTSWAPRESIGRARPSRSVFAYVLEGSVVSQVGDEKPMTYTKGLVSKNASQTEPAKLLVFLLSQDGESIKAPIK
jgi:quercetin dioxygenase-like cupin family protein